MFTCIFALKYRKSGIYRYVALKYRKAIPETGKYFSPLGETL